MYVYEDESLQCVTDLKPCCGPGVGVPVGRWFYPNGTEVGRPYYAHWMGASVYRNRGVNGTVNLNHERNNVKRTTGNYCCVVPDINGTDQTQCANIGKRICVCDQP